MRNANKSPTPEMSGFTNTESSKTNLDIWVFQGVLFTAQSPGLILYCRIKTDCALGTGT